METKETAGMSDEHFQMLLEGKEITEVVETKRGEATIKFMSDMNRVLIIRRKAELLAGGNASSLNEIDKVDLEIVALLDVLVEVGPEGWEVGNSLAYPDREVKTELYGRCLQLIQNVRGLRRPSENVGDGAGETEKPDSQEATDNSDLEPEKPAPKLSGKFRRKK
ncbi:MAG: hypothetical protein AAF975_03995 [Spirochaetota bacterium]